MELDKWHNLLNDHGYRVTAARCAVLRALHGSDVPLTPQEIAERGQAYHAALGLVTAYRTLELFERLGIVHRIHRPDGCHGFVLGEPGHQHTLVCRQCGRTQVFVGCAALEALTEHLEATTGYRIDGHLLQFIGLCQTCQDDKSTGGTKAPEA